MMNLGTLQPSGRVIAGGRLLLAGLFLLAVWADRSQPSLLPGATYVLLAVYLAWSLGITLAIWNNWWADARLAAPAHVVDVAVFVAMLYSTEGYTSPYFTFFVFILLSAAIRWGWRETALTAATVVLIYFTSGLLIPPIGEFDVERFIVRTGHLLILSAILIWFGANQRIAWPLGSWKAPEPAVGGSEPIATALLSAMANLGARQGRLLWRDAESGSVSMTRVDGDKVRRMPVAKGSASAGLAGHALYDVQRNRLLTRDITGRWLFLKAAEFIPAWIRDCAQPASGLAVVIRTSGGNGTAMFQQVPNLSTDHLDIADRVGQDLAAQLDAAVAFASIETASMAKARVAVARDLHDSIVQFLAGLGFRLEALVRSGTVDERLSGRLMEIKRLVLDEQEQLRVFIGALSTGGSVTLDDLERDIGGLCKRLAGQWNISCDFAGDCTGGSVPVRLQLELQHLIREGVANAVRHGGAANIRVSLENDARDFRLRIEDDGAGFPAAAEAAPARPDSLAGRVREAKGDLDVRSVPGDTRISIRIPLEA
jgi:signal transduction histidine kinase